MHSILDPYAKERLKILVAEFDSLRNSLPIALTRDLEELGRKSNALREGKTPVANAMRASEYYSVIDQIESRRDLVNFYYRIQDSRCMFCEAQLSTPLIAHLAFFESIHDIILGNSIVRAEGLSVIFRRSLRGAAPNADVPSRAHKTFMAPMANIAAQGMVCLDCKRASYNAAWGGPRTIINPMIDDMADYFFSDSEGRLYFDISEIPPAPDDIPSANSEERTINLLDLNRLALVRKRQSAYHSFAESLARHPISQAEFGDLYKRALASEYSCTARSALRDAVGGSKFGKYLSEFYATDATYAERADYSGGSAPPDIIRPGRKIRSVSITNYRGFSCEGVDFKVRHEPSRAQDFVPDLALLAPNGEGKTRFLQALSWALAARDDVTELLRNTRPEFWPKGTTIIIRFLEADDIELYVNFPKTFSLKSRKYIRTIRLAGYNAEMSPSTDENSQFHDRIPFVAFGAHRVVEFLSEEKNSREHFEPNDLSLFGHRAPLDRAIAPGVLKERPQARKFISWLLTSLLQLPEPEAHYFLFEHQGDGWDVNYHAARHSPLPIDQISDGLQSVVWLGLTIMFRLFDELKSDGIVLVDELDAHLHPSWRLVFRRALKTAFPNIQLIFTTHDPIILRGMSASNVFRLLPGGKRRASKAVTLAEEAESLEGYEVDDLLISDLFGLTRLREPDSEEEYNRYLELLAQQYISGTADNSDEVIVPARIVENHEQTELNILRERFSGGYAGYRHPRDRFLIPLFDELFALDEADKAGKLPKEAADKIKRFKKMILDYL